MNKDWVILGTVVFVAVALLIRLLYVEDVCEAVVDKHIGNSIPRTVKVNSHGNILTGECSYKLVSQSFEVK
jgi:hypothetical protein